MHPRLLTRKAFSIFYGSNRVVLLDPSLTKKATPELDGVAFLFLGTDGLLYASGETEVSVEGALAPVGAPTGVLGVIARSKLENQVQQWSTWFEHQTGRAAPPTYLIKVRKTEPGLYKALAACLARDAASSRAGAADTEKDLAFLRRDFEQALINLEKARRLIRGVGFDTRFATLSLPLGSKTIVPPHDEETSVLKPYSKSYGLPVDAAGMIGLSLHCQFAEGDRAEGTFAVGVYRFVDNLCLGSASIEFGDMHSGWFYLELDQVMQRSFGDAYLVLEWSQANKGAVPAITLSSLKSETRQSEEPSDQEIPALQVWSGFAPGELSNQQGFSPMNAFRRSASFAELEKFGALLAGSDAASTIEAGQSWLQTHLVPGPVGIQFEDLLPASASRIEIQCETAHVSGPECHYLIAVTHKGLELSADDFTALLADAREQGSHGGVDESRGLAWSSTLVPTNTVQTIGLNLPSGFRREGAGNMYAVVVSATGKQDYGWCRWHDVTVSVPMDTVGAPSARLSTVDTVTTQRMRSLKFPEVGDQLEFLAGTAKLQKLSSKLGFSPMIVAEDNGSLQTHPLLDDISAVLYREGVLAGVTRVACDVETAHEQSPDFRYVMALLPAKTSDKNDVFTNFLDRALPKNTKFSQGTDDVSGIIFSTKQLSALEVSTISIDLDKPLDETYDIIVAVLPVQGSVSYGWCRWMSLSVSSVMEHQQEHRLLAETEQG